MIELSANVVPFEARSQSRQAADDFFTASDGAKLHYRSWPAQNRAAGALILLHRGHEHAGRWNDVVRDLDLASHDIAAFAFDARGHGQSEGERGYASSLSTLVSDLDAFVRFVSTTQNIPIDRIIILAHSVSAVVATAWVHDYAPPIRGLILATPAFSVKLYVPLALPSLRAIAKLRRSPMYIKSYVRPKMLTHDSREADAYANDPLISKQIAVNVLVDLFDTSRRLLADAPVIRTPLLMLTAGADWVVKNGPSRTFFERVGSPRKSALHLDGFGHAIFHEVDRATPIAKVKEFVLAAMQRETNDEPIVSNAERFAELSRPLPALSFARFSFAMQKVFLRTLGRLSRGIDLGWHAGFSSGQSLDHVYDNRPAGRTPLGRLIDRFFLSAIGWRMIRVRKQNLQRLLDWAIDNQRSRAPHSPLKVIDLAAGAGRYLIETIAARSDGNQTAILCDMNQGALTEARNRIQAMSATTVTTQESDAFDPDQVRAVAASADIAIVSGLYELFPENRMVQQSLSSLGEAMREGSLLIYTNQLWHPQLDMIARVLTHGDGSPWIMRCRSQAEMDQLVANAGFEKFGEAIDPAGIFSVSIARKR